MWPPLGTARTTESWALAVSYGRAPLPAALRALWTDVVTAPLCEGHYHDRGKNAGVVGREEQGKERRGREEEGREGGRG